MSSSEELLLDHEGGVSLRETIASVLKTLDSLSFDLSPAMQANAEHVVGGMTTNECEDALRSAALSDLLSKPVYYSILVDSVRHSG